MLLYLSWRHLKETSYKIWPYPVNMTRFLWPIGGRINRVPLYYKWKYKLFFILFILKLIKINSYGTFSQKVVQWISQHQKRIWMSIIPAPIVSARGALTWGGDWQVSLKSLGDSPEFDGGGRLGGGIASLSFSSLESVVAEGATVGKTMDPPKNKCLWVN